MSGRPAVAWLGDEHAHDVSLVGGKAAALSQLAEAHPVPRGFALTTAAHEQATIEGAAYVHALVEEAYARLEERVETADLAVAVRSSAVDEDGAAASFAGQHETYLNVRGVAAVAEAVGACFESAHAEHALEYRRRQGIDADAVRMAVLVQQLVPADAAFSANPITQSRDEIVINASWGLGESIVGGTVTPDTYIVEKSGLTISQRFLGAKESMTVPVEGGTREVDVPGRLRDRHALDDHAVVELAQLALALEEQAGHPVDIESAFHEKRLYLLQSRPITTLRGV
jgi:phosphoenolpyruvate synthase/pyruvate phosphate dikinase